MERRISESIDTSDEKESSEEVKVLKMLVKSSNTTKVEVPMYEGNLNVEDKKKYNPPRERDSFTMKRVLVNTKKKVHELSHKNSLFRTKCKSQGKCC